MEKLKIINVRGEVVLEHDLAGEKGPIVVVVKPEKVELASEVSAEDRLLGALIRTVDGWDLASSDPVEPVRSGSKSQGSMPMLAGTSLSLGDYVFVLESEKTETRDVLIWRVGKSAFSADALLPGRNAVAVDQVTGRVMLNPLLSKEIRFTFFLTDDGIETVANDGAHLAVPQRIRFACGEFEGMVLPASEAAKAIRDRNPFSYPSHGIRQKLLFWTIGALAFLAIAGKLHQEALTIERQSAAVKGVELVSEPPVELGAAHGNDGLAFKFAVIRDMPLVLGPVRTQVASDLIERAKSLPDTPDIAETVAFIRDVSEIQDLANAGRWDDLGALAARAKDGVFAYYEATAFLSDARTLAQVFRTDIPKLYNELMFSPVSKSAALTNAVAGCCNRLKGNVFCGSDNVRFYIDGIAVQLETVCEAARWLERMRGSEPLSADDLLELRVLLARVTADFDEPACRPMVVELRKRLADWSSGEVKGILAKYEPGNPTPDASSARVTPLCDLAEDVGVDRTVVAEWRKTAKEIERRLELRYRELYQTYRLGGAMSQDEALKIVDEMLAIGGAGGKFRKWALREKERLANEKEVK